MRLASNGAVMASGHEDGANSERLTSQIEAAAGGFHRGAPQAEGRRACRQIPAQR
jgi:hypothetical protein